MEWLRNSISCLGLDDKDRVILQLKIANVILDSKLAEDRLFNRKFKIMDVFGVFCQDKLIAIYKNIEDAEQYIEAANNDIFNYNYYSCKSLFVQNQFSSRIIINENYLKF